MRNNYKCILVIIISIFYLLKFNYFDFETFKNDECDCKNMKENIKINSIELEINKIKMTQEKLKKNQKKIQNQIKEAQNAAKESENEEKLI